MLAKIKTWAAGLGGDASAAPATPPPREELAAATALLLAEAASLDGEFDEGEEQVIADLLVRRFDLSDGEAADVVADARAGVDENVELFGLTRVIKSHLEPDQRVAVIEMLWEVVYADGALHDFEANLARRVAGLLHLSDRDTGAARKRVLARLEVDGDPA